MSFLSNKNGEIFVGKLLNAEQRLLEICQGTQIVIVTDSSTERCCLPLLRHHMPTICQNALYLSVQAGTKSIQEAVQLWQQLAQLHIGRHCHLIALGGGTLSDLVGFVASTYMRGVGFVTIPTTLLAAIDASIGGKTALDLPEAKNLVGSFYMPHLTIISEAFYETLPKHEILSGYGEVVKYALLQGMPLWGEVLQSEPHLPSRSVIEPCVRYKEAIVKRDPHDRGVRQWLNLGHTIGHALESWGQNSSHSVPHGIAVAAGIVAELYLSRLRYKSFTADHFYSVIEYIKRAFPAVHFSCRDYPAIVERCLRDKKNSAHNQVAAVLLRALGKPEMAYDITTEEIEEALDFYRDYMQV